MPITNTNETLSIIRHRILAYLVVLFLGAILAFPGSAQNAPPRVRCEQVYMMSYFTTAHEALHLAYSCDAYVWATINDGQPIIRSEFGMGRMRDPFILPDPRDGGFHLVWTIRWGSIGIGYAHSDDLITWGEQRVLPLMVEVEYTRNIWGPEIFYDQLADEFRLLWASTVHETETDRYLNAWSHRIWTATTQDFHTFSASEKLFDPDYTVIDATLIYHNQKYVMIYKDERGLHIPSTIQKAMRVATADAVTGPFEIREGLVTPRWTEGPTVFQGPDGQWLMFYDHFEEDRFGASISQDLYHWENITDQILFPPRPRHGAVFTVPHTTFERLYAALG